jgi:hypothetical protein
MLSADSGVGATVVAADEAEWRAIQNVEAAV